MNNFEVCKCYFEARLSTFSLHYSPVYDCVFVCVCVHVCVCNFWPTLSAIICFCVCMCLCVCVLHVCVHAFTWMYVCVCVCVCFLLCVSVYVSVRMLVPYVCLYVDCPATPGNQEKAALKHTHLKYTAALLSSSQWLRQLNHAPGRRNC